MRNTNFQRLGTFTEKPKKRPVLLTAFFAVSLVVFGSYFILPLASVHISRPEISEDYGIQEFLISDATNFVNSSVEAKTEIMNVPDSIESSSKHAQTTEQTDNSTKRNLLTEIEHINKSSANVIFIETRCSVENMKTKYLDNKGFVLNARQCCAIESTALTNPDHEIFVFHSCPFSDDFLDHSPQFVRQLFSYPNVHIVRFDNSQVFVGSPVQQLFEQRQLEKSSFPIEHSSDVIRLLLLWQFGGTYLDLDVVTIKSLNELKNNWIGEEDAATLANGVMNFEPEGEAHSMLQHMLEHINQHYDPTGWSTNGPQLVTSFLLKECNISKLEDAKSYCRMNFTVYNNKVHYPVHYSKVKDLFDGSLGHQILKDVNGSVSVHFWNKLSHEYTVTVGSSQVYALLADQYCPKVYRNCGPTF